MSWQEIHKPRPDLRRDCRARFTHCRSAAEIEGRTLTDFVVSAAREAACRTIEQTEIIRLSIEEQRRIHEALLNPPEPTTALKKAFQRRRELFGGG
jgi:uncharacterized protein (DUF1778 family)